MPVFKQFYLQMLTVNLLPNQLLIFTDSMKLPWCALGTYTEYLLFVPVFVSDLIVLSCSQSF